MAGYIGSKAVLLSTTAATVTGDAQIGGDLTVDTNTLFVDAANNRVGVGTATPSFELDVVGVSDPSIRVRATGAGSSDDALLRMSVGNADASNYIQFGDNSDSDAGYIRYQHANDSLQIGVNAAERMRIDASGNVGIGTASPSAGAIGGKVIHVQSSGATASIRVDRSDASTAGTLSMTSGNSTNGLFGTGAKPITFSTDSTERARIDASGNLLVGTTTAFGTAGTTIASPDSSGFWSATTSAGGINHLRFYNPNGVVGGISTSGVTTSYTTSSDHRLKENVIPLSGAADRLAQIPVHRFNFIADPERTVDGFLAHEVQAFVPECVTGLKDQVKTVEVTDEDGNVTTETRPVYQGIDQSKLVPLLTAALQEALTEIQDLKARVATLEGGAA
jgi:hypothetical protein